MVVPSVDGPVIALSWRAAARGAKSLDSPVGTRVAHRPIVRFRTLAFFSCSLFLGSALSGCGTEGTSGALGQSEVSPGCSSADGPCLTSGLDAPIAMGARVPIEVSIVAQGAAAPPLTFVSGNTSVFSVDGTEVVGEGGGVAALLFTDPEGSVIDFIHLYVAQPTALELHRADGGELSARALGERMELLVGDDFALAAVPYVGAQAMIGELEIEWSAEGDAVQMLDEGIGSMRRLVAREEGTATLRVTGFEQERSIELEVLP